MTDYERPTIKIPDDGTQANDDLPLELWSRDRLLVSLATWGYCGLLTKTDDELRTLVRDRSARRLALAAQDAEEQLRGRCVRVPQDVVCDTCGDESNSEPDLPCGRVEYDESDLTTPISEPCNGTYRTRS